jgi:hypothetical protein
MLHADLLGWLAAGLTLACFASSDMLRLRLLALAANAAFIAYAWQEGLHPVLALHLALAPVNAWRLWPLLRAGLSRRASSTWASSRGSPAARRGSS